MNYDEVFELMVGYPRSAMDKVLLADGREMKVHPASVCADDETCCIHKPSDHHMREWPMNWRSDRAIMERIDPRTGIGHPDPDDVAHHMRVYPEDKYYTVHGCDGACSA